MPRSSPRRPHAAHAHAFVVALLCLAAAVTHVSASYYVATTGGVDSPTCTSATKTPCATIRYCVDRINAAKQGTTIYLADGIYSGPEHTNLVVDMTMSTAPFLIRGQNATASSVIIDLEYKNRFINITVGVGAGNSFLRALTIMNGYGSQYGAVFVQAARNVPATGFPDKSVVNADGTLNGTSTIPAFTFNAVYFNNCAVIGEPVTATDVPIAGAAVVTGFKMSTSAWATSTHVLYYPPAPNASLVPDPSSILPSPLDTVPTKYNALFTPEYQRIPPDQPTEWRPAVIFTNCLFTNNTVLGTNFDPSGGAAAAIASDSSYTYIRGTNFVFHLTHQQQSWITHFSGPGFAYLRQCEFSDNVLGPINMNGGAIGRGGHSLLVATSYFYRNGDSSPATLSQTAKLVGEYQAGVAYAVGPGSFTQYGGRLLDGFGIGYNFQGGVIARVYTPSLRQHTCGAKNFLYAGSSSILLAAGSFQSNSGLGGIFLGRISSAPTIMVVGTYFRAMAGEQTGLLDLTGAPANTMIWFKNTRFDKNFAMQGSTIYSSFDTHPTAQVVFEMCTFTDNIAVRQGSVASLQQGQVWFLGSNFTTNTALQGSVIYGGGGYVEVNGATFTRNKAQNGGAIYLTGDVDARIVSSNFVGNIASDTGGAVCDGSNLWARYKNVTFFQNTADEGAAVYFPIPINSVGAKSDPEYFALSPTVSAMCNTSFQGVSFLNNTASVFGGAVRFEGSTLPCESFCGPLPDADSIIATTTADVWETERCTFVGNVAQSGYGSNFATGLHHMTVLDHSESVDSTKQQSIVIQPGLPFDVTVSLFDVLNRPFGVSGSGASGVTIQLLVFSAGRLLNPLGTQLSTQLSTVVSDLTLPTASPTPVSLLSSDVLIGQVQGGQATFHLHVLVEAGVSPNLTLAVVADLTDSSSLALPLRVTDCPGGMLLALVEDGGGASECILRPSFLAGDAIKVVYNIPLVLLSLFICIIGMWTCLIVVEQVISARGRNKSVLLWLVACACSFGFSALWCMAVVSITSLSLESEVTGASVGFTVLPMYVFVSLVCLVAAPFGGLYLAFTDRAFRQKTSNDRSRVRKYMRQVAEPQWKRQTDSSGIDSSSYEPSTTASSTGSYVRRINHSKLSVPTEVVAPKANQYQASPQTLRSLHISPSQTRGNGPLASHGASVPVTPQLAPFGDNPPTDSPMGSPSGTATPIVGALDDGGRHYDVQLPILANSAAENEIGVRTRDPTQAEELLLDGSGGMDQQQQHQQQAEQHVVGFDGEAEGEGDGGEAGAAEPTTETVAAADASTSLTRSRFTIFIMKQAVQPRIFFGLLLVFAGMAAGLVVMIAGIDLDADCDVEMRGTFVTLALVCSFLLFYPSMLLYLYLFTQLRMASVFVLVASVVVAMYTSIGSLSIHYVAASSSKSDGLDTSTMALVAFAAAMVSSVAFVGINVVSLRLSRHQLGMAMRNMGEDLLRTHDKLMGTTQEVGMLQTWLAMSGRSKVLAGVRNRAIKVQKPAIRPVVVLHPDSLDVPGTPDAAASSGVAASSDALAKEHAAASEWIDLNGLLGLCALKAAVQGGRSGAQQNDSDEMGVLFGSKVDLSDRTSILRSAVTCLLGHRLLSPGLESLQPHLLPRLSLESVLSHPVCMSMFLEHAARTHNEDLLLAYLALAQYRETSDPFLRTLMGAQISIDYLADGSEFEINVSGTIKATLLHTIQQTRGSSLPPNLFVSLERELVALIRTNLWLSYTNTRSYLMSAIVMDAVQHAAREAEVEKSSRVGSSSWESSHTKSA